MSPRSTDPAGELTDHEFECVRWLFARAGLDLNQYRLETIKRRLPACIRALRVQSIDEVCSEVRNQPKRLGVAISALVIGVTSFFRDPAVFAALKQQVLPEMLRTQPAPRVWSVGCSDGAELYSVAMLLEQAGVLPQSHVVGTDCRADALERARAGSFDSSAVRNLPGDLRERYMSFDGACWTVSPELRARIDWRLRNALGEGEPGTWDLILCRNMAIYLEPSAVGALWGGLSRAVRPGGFLVLGKAERPYGATGLRPVAPCVYQREWS